ncbi:hypothetical protein F2981_16970 [Sinorhizobium meliloti]|nr:hypothetical protein [Sinorhizobium meliloti]
MSRIRCLSRRTAIASEYFAALELVPVDARASAFRSGVSQKQIVRDLVNWYGSSAIVLVLVGRSGPAARRMNCSMASLHFPLALARNVSGRLHLPATSQASFPIEDAARRMSSMAIGCGLLTHGRLRAALIMGRR